MKNKSKEKSILFLSNDASRGGAIILLLNLLRFIKENTNIPFLLILNRGGDLESEFRKICKVFVCDFNEPTRIKLRQKISFYIRKILHFDHPQFSSITNYIKKANVQLIYSNTIHNEKAIFYLAKKINCKIILHVHEADYILDLYNQNGLLGNQFELIDNFIVASDVVKEALINKFRINNSVITVVYGGIPPDFYNEKSSPDEIKFKLNLPLDAYIVLGMGNLHWIKGVDLFIQVAIKSVKSNQDIYFIWVGKTSDSDYEKKLQFDIEQSGIKKYFRFVQETDSPITFFKLCNLFFLSSRTESFSLATLQSVVLKKPLICFQNIGGPSEILGKDSVLLVPYNDIDKVFEKILYFRNNQDKAMAIMESHYANINTEYDFKIMATKIIQIISSLVPLDRHNRKIMSDARVLWL